jgi:hypothetical protein
LQKKKILKNESVTKNDGKIEALALARQFFNNDEIKNSINFNQEGVGDGLSSMHKVNNEKTEINESSAGSICDENDIF